ncbi:amino acid permease 6-like protein [Carex littledalei]|uniref:Amino acid permease 6-like protein n=1 Tax=Carex littledalei TaxID=544730 RepID=A0A833V0C3_9POAL|nr:amino acid permease 6-like protein [Carex littledalei]
MEMERRIGKDVEGGANGDQEKQGTVWSASAHIVAAVVGSGVLALAWTVAQLGWVIGPIALFGFSCVTYYTSAMLADCYRYPDPVTGTINHEYIDAVRCYLGRKSEILCGCAQYVNLWGTLVGYTITASTSMIAVKRANCFHRYGHDTSCTSSGSTFMVIFGLFQLVLSQLPSLENITWLSVVAVATSFGYSFISLGLCAGKLASHGEFRGTLTGTSSAKPGDKAFNVLLALGNMAFAYTFADVLIEIQSTLKSPPAENKTMKKATFYGLGLTTIFYLLLGCIGYAAFGNSAPGNILTGFGFYEPFWLVDMANVCVIVHLIGAYQVYAQPIFARLESFIEGQWPEAKFLHKTYYIATLNVSILSLVLRTILIMFTTLVAMLVPFFNAVLGLIGAVGFWPLSVYFPVNMHISQKKIRRGEPKWFWLQGLSFICLLISLAASIGSVQDIVHNLKTAALFKTVY